MRLWHKDLISALPRQQLLSQWRECCCIARNWAANGTPNHLLVNKVTTYPVSHFIAYTDLVISEFKRRGYNISAVSKSNFDANMQRIHDRVEGDTSIEVRPVEIYSNWHNRRYLKQCYANLQEKYDCGGITDTEWARIILAVHKTKPIERRWAV